MIFFGEKIPQICINLIIFDDGMEKICNPFFEIKIMAVILPKLFTEVIKAIRNEVRFKNLKFLSVHFKGSKSRIQIYSGT